MDSEAVPKSPKRAKVSDEESEDCAIEDTNSRNTELSGTSADLTTPDSQPEPKPKTSDEEVVIISSDDDSDKDAAKTKLEEKANQEDECTATDKPLPTDAQSMETDTNISSSENKTKVDADSKTNLEQSDNSETESQTADKKLSDKSPASDSSDECISQEDLLAHLGLGSVRALSNPKPKKEEKISNGVLSERKPLIPHKPKESIVDLLRAPKLKSHEEKPKVNGEAPITVVNGISDDDDSTPGTPSEADDDDELLAKEQLIEELRQELRNEEAKLLLLKKIQAAQNDPKNASKYVKEKENEKLLSSSVQYAGSKSASNQLTMKKGQSLPPPPPLKTHISTAGTYQPPVAIQPKLLPKTGNVQSLHGSSLSSSKSANQIQQSSKSPSRSGSSAIKDLQNVISSMSTNLIHPTPMYPRAGSQANVYTTHAQAAPVRPTPVRANNVPGANTSSGYSSFPTHISTKASSPNPAVSTAGKQAAAKMALRKQLEKTLLQIPPPKPPPAEWSFIPSLNSTEFMTLVGFEKVVDAISQKENPKGKSSSPPLAEKAQQENPKVCGQCGTDFTPCWKTKNKDGAEVLMCEKCSTVNVKKELKTEHTARLKAAFLKALKQEQEIEQKMSETTPIAPKPQSSKSSSHSSSSSSSSRHHHISHHQGVLHHRHQHVQPGIYHHHQQHPDSLLYQLQQQHLQQQQQEMEVARRHGDVRWHPYMTQHHHSSHKPQHHHSIVSDSDRQYLLDMIPSLPAQYSSSRI